MNDLARSLGLGAGLGALGAAQQAAYDPYMNSVLQVEAAKYEQQRRAAEAARQQQIQQQQVILLLTGEDE